MKATISWKRTIRFVIALGALFPLLVQAGAMGNSDCVSVNNRPLSDFLDAQGTENDPPMFFPPVPDYVGWAGDFAGVCGEPGTFQGTFGLVDYAGLANEFIMNNGGQSLRTKIKGQVKECVLADGSARITVNISTSKGLGFAQSIDALCQNGFDFANTPTNFGNKALDVLNGAPAAVGQVTFKTSFTVDNPGDELPDFLNVAFGNEYAPATLYFRSRTFAARPGGSPTFMRVLQKATVAPGADWVYTVEEVEIVHGN